MSEVVTKLEEAAVGSIVWLYDMDANRYEEGQYKGRGVYRVAKIDAETRKSFSILGSKFDRKTGAQIGLGGYSPRKAIMGDAERARKEFLSNHRHELSRQVGFCDDVEALEKVANAIGYKLEGRP